jgi:putative ABC transport system permease protein
MKMMYNLTRFNEYLIMAWGALKNHKLRSLLTTLGILIGVTTIITIWTTIQGLNEYVYGQLSNIGASTVYVQKFPWVITDDYWKFRNRDDITYKEYEAIDKYATLADAVSPQVESMRQVSYGTETYEQIRVVGTNEDYMETANVYPEVGRFFTSLEVMNNHHVVVLGAELASNLFGQVNPIGRRIKIDSKKYQVVGILEKKGTVFGQSMDNYAIVPIGTFRGIYGGRRGLSIAVMTNNADNLEALKDQLRGIMRRVRKTNPLAEDDFAINQQDMLTDFYAKLTGTLFMIVFVIGGISLLVGGIGIMNIMLVSVTERTREIGIRKAIGAKRKNVLSQFLIEAIVVSSIGGFIGIIFGYAGGSVVLSTMHLTIGVSISAILIGFGFSSVVGVLAGFYPAYKASKLNPIDSLRYE